MDMTTPVIGNHKLTNLISDRQLELGKSNEELAAALGFERSIIMSMIKSGTVKFPLNKIPALATALELDTSELLVMAMKDYAPDLLDLVEHVWGPRGLPPRRGALGSNLT